MDHLGLETQEKLEQLVVALWDILAELPEPVKISPCPGATCPGLWAAYVRALTVAPDLPQLVKELREKHHQ